MKKFLYLLVAAFCANVSLANAEETPLSNREISSIEKQIKKLESQISNSLSKKETAEIELLDAQSKVEEFIDKPKSAQYKSALKKTESLPAKIESYSISIQAAQHQIDSLKGILCESQVSTTSVNLAEDCDNSSYTKAEIEMESTPTKDIEPADDICEEGDVVEDLPADYVYTEEEKIVEPDSVLLSFWGKVWRFFKIVFWIIVGLIALVIFGKIGSSASGSSNHGRATSNHRRDEASVQKKFNREREQRNKKAIQEQIFRKQEKIEDLKREIERYKGYAARARSASQKKQELAHVSTLKQRIASERAEINRLKARKL